MGGGSPYSCKRLWSSVRYHLLLFTGKVRSACLDARCKSRRPMLFKLRTSACRLTFLETGRQCASSQPMRICLSYGISPVDAQAAMFLSDCSEPRTYDGLSSPMPSQPTVSRVHHCLVPFVDLISRRLQHENTLFKLKLNCELGSHTPCLGFEHVERWKTASQQRQTWR